MSRGLASRAGLVRSLAVYYLHPLRHARLKRLYGAFVRPGDLVIDAGAHVGNHVRAFLTLGARVVAVEPQRVFAQFLRSVFRKNANVTVLEAAAGAVPGRAAIHISSRTPTVSSLAAPWRERVAAEPAFRRVRWDRVVDVNVFTLDQVIERHGRPVFIKLDVEGYEAEVLSGLSEPVPALCFEVLPAAPEPRGLALDRLSRLGFNRFNWTIGEQAILQPDWVPASEVRAMLDGLLPGQRERNIFARSDAA